MNKGKAPKGPDGKALELHHVQPLSQGGTNDFGNLKIMDWRGHRVGPNFRLNHPRLR
jgi:hypothetical protein